jgi:hypothetical protein
VTPAGRRNRPAGGAGGRGSRARSDPARRAAPRRGGREHDRCRRLRWRCRALRRADTCAGRSASTRAGASAGCSRCGHKAWVTVLRSRCSGHGAPVTVLRSRCRDRPCPAGSPQRILTGAGTLRGGRDPARRGDVDPCAAAAMSLWLAEGWPEAGTGGVEQVTG